MRYDEYLRKMLFALSVLAMMMAFMLLHGCKTKYVSVPEYHQIFVDRRDTLMLHDSIYQKEYIDRFVKGDTVFLVKTQVDYKYKFLYKTRDKDSVRVDSIRVPYPVEKDLTRWQKLKMDIGGFAIGIVAISILVAVGWLVRKWLI